MLIVSLVLGLALGMLAGGRITNLASVRLRLVQLLFLGLALRYMTQFAIDSGIGFASDFRLPLFAGGFVLLLMGLWVNREQPGLPLAFVGILLNAVAIVTNGGFMPVWEPSLAAAGLTPADVGSTFHKLVGAVAEGGIPSNFLAQAGPLGDIIPIPIPFIRNVASIGDIFLQPGEMSLHHTRLIHFSEPNNSSRRRIGIAISYVPTSVDCTSKTRHTAMLVRGTDRYRHFDPEPRVRFDFDPENAGDEAVIIGKLFGAFREINRRGPHPLRRD